jgi:C1A family cysteine protease
MSDSDTKLNIIDTIQSEITVVEKVINEVKPLEDVISAVVDEVVIGIDSAIVAINDIKSAISNNFIRVNHPFNVLINRIHPSKLDMLEIPKLKTASYPTVVDLRDKFQAVYDQGELGSCTANALCGLMGFDDPTLLGSRLFVYYNERKIENDIPDDGGAQLSDGVWTLQKYGVCQETEWPYDVSKFAEAPPPKAYASALKHQALRVKNINNDVTSMKNALAQGYPFVVGIVVYPSFQTAEVAQTGLVPMPSPNEQSIGGHAVVCVGYDDAKKVWIMRNSWGTGWGDAGYFYLPYLYLLDSRLSSDLWNIISVEKSATESGFTDPKIVAKNSCCCV